MKWVTKVGVLSGKLSMKEVIFSANVTDDGQMTLSGGVNDYIHDPNARRLRETIKRHVGRVLSMNPNLGRGSS